MYNKLSNEKKNCFKTLGIDTIKSCTHRKKNDDII